MYYKRLSTFSELNQESVVDSRILKKIQGRDIVTSRQMYKNPCKIPMGSSIMIVNNGVVKVSEYDLMEKFEIIETPYRFVTSKDSLEDGEKRANQTIEFELDSLEWRCAFIRMCFNMFGTTIVPPTENMIELKSNVNILTTKEELDN